MKNEKPEQLTKNQAKSVSPRRLGPKKTATVDHLRCSINVASTNPCRCVRKKFEKCKTIFQKIAKYQYSVCV